MHLAVGSLTPNLKSGTKHIFPTVSGQESLGEMCLLCANKTLLFEISETSLCYSRLAYGSEGARKRPQRAKHQRKWISAGMVREL